KTFATIEDILVSVLKAFIPTVLIGFIISIACLIVGTTQLIYQIFVDANLKSEVATPLTVAVFSSLILLLTTFSNGFITLYQIRSSAIKNRNDEVHLIQAEFVHFLVEARSNLIKRPSYEQEVLNFRNKITAKIIESGSPQVQKQWSILKPEFTKICLNSDLDRSYLNNILNFLEALRKQLGYGNSRLHTNTITQLLQ
ncbi:hypothetical protein C7Y66_00565, partial [Chroococcidiopsis sp. CCALA 051]|uniref:hypothetical protein n=2 Tax=unclassified Chroococcidiopsis TaxID=2646205 RepID=UPI000D2D514A